MELLRCSVPNCRKIITRKQTLSNMWHVDVPGIPEGTMIALIYLCDHCQDKMYELYGKATANEDTD